MIKLIVGLGNPGEEYSKTRHNVGFWLLNFIIKNYGGDLKSNKKLHGLFGSTQISTQTIYFLKPTTFMNESGIALRACIKFFDIKPQEVLVLHDELDLAVGIIRLKFAGGHGGHNGLRSIINHLGTADFWRLRIGIDHPKNKNLVSGYVLSPPNAADFNKIEEGLQALLPLIPDIVGGSQQKVMLKLHT